MGVRTSEENDLKVGTNNIGNHFNGILDELRFYEYALSSQEVNSVALNGTMKFQTSTVSVPPVIELISLSPRQNGSLTVTGKLISKDSEILQSPFIMEKKMVGLNSRIGSIQFR